MSLSYIPYNDLILNYCDNLVYINTILYLLYKFHVKFIGQNELFYYFVFEIESSYSSISSSHTELKVL